jgi:hypothetical protein
MIPLLIIFSIIIIYLIITYKSIPDEDSDSDDEYLSEYKLKKKKKTKKKYNDIFNIKEYDKLNENIIIHNKYKNELLEWNNDKIKNNQKEIIKQSLEKEKQKEIIIKNSEIIRQNELKQKILKKKYKLENLEKSLKDDLNNIKYDIEHNNILANDKQKLLTDLTKYINEINNEYIHLKDIDDKLQHSYKTLLKKELKLLKNRQILYQKLLNN